MGISYILSFPYERKYYGDIADPTNTEVLAVKERVAKVKEHYPEDVQESIDDFVVQILTRANKPVLHLQGLPGTGKTYFAERIAEALGLPLIKISPGEKAEKIFNSSVYSSSLGSFMSKDLSQLAYAFAHTPLIEGKKLKGIVFFDEVEKLLEDKDSYDKIALTKLLELLESSRSEWEFKEVHFTYDISGWAFILAGNRPLQNDALRSRIKTILFKGFPADKKTEIAKKKFMGLVKEKQQQVSSFQPTEQERSVVDDIIAEDPNEGVRELLAVLEEYVGFLIKKRLSHVFSNQEGKIFDITAAFQQRGAPEKEEEAQSSQSLELTEEEQAFVNKVVISIQTKEIGEGMEAVIAYILEQRKLRNLPPSDEAASASE